MKRLLPKRLKQFLWFVFKSPQRHWIGWQSLKTDFLGFLAILKKRKRYERLTVCVGVKNRSHHLIHHLIASMNRCAFRRMLHLSVYDCGTDDVANLEEEILKHWDGPFIYTRAVQPFARSKAFNEAVKQAKTDLLLICDADMSLPADIVEKVSRYTTEKTAWFPMVWYTNEDGSGRYYQESTGMFSAFKKAFLSTGGYDETITEWGKEDWLLFFEFYKQEIACYRTRERNFIHHYHPSLKPADFKPLF